jgi:hypothetical protein
MSTYFTGPLKTGVGLEATAPATGTVVNSQTTTVTTTADGLPVSATIVIPANAQIINFFVDTMVTPVVGGGTATTCPVTVGTAAAGAQYMGSTDLVAGGRAAPTLTTAQLAAMANVGANTSVVITADPNGTVSTTQGVFRLTVVYAQR